jgi:hypothetical protein
MPWSYDDAQRAEEEERAFLLGLYRAGRWRELADAYCHEGLQVYRGAYGRILEAGICSYRVCTDTEEGALVLVAAHIKAQIDAGVLGC